MSGPIDHLPQLATPWAYLLVGLLAAAESAAFIGLVIPGETAMLLGGVLVATAAWVTQAADNQDGVAERHDTTVAPG